MTIASPAVRGAQRQLVVPPALSANGAAEQMRDQLTRERLMSVVDHLPGLVVESYDRSWWDGQVHVPSLVVRAGAHLRRMRVVETEGDCLVVPHSRRLAHRWLAARRRPRRVELDGVVRRTTATPVVIDGMTDARRCATNGCGALRLLGQPGCCPLCGG